MLLRHSLTVIPKDEMPFIALFFCFQRHSCPFSGIGNGIIHKITEYTVQQASITLHNNAFRQFIIESHVMSFSFQSRLTIDFCHHHRDIHRLKIYHIRTVIQSVQGRDITEQRGKTLALRITALQEQGLRFLIDMGIVKNGFQISLNTGYRGFEFVSDILGKLALQDILLLTRCLNTLVHLDDSLGNLTQLIIREFSQILHLQALIMIRLISKDTEFGYILRQSVCKTV